MGFYHFKRPKRQGKLYQAPNVFGTEYFKNRSYYCYRHQHYSSKMTRYIKENCFSVCFPSFFLQNSKIQIGTILYSMECILYDFVSCLITEQKLPSFCLLEDTVHMK